MRVIKFYILFQFIFFGNLFSQEEFVDFSISEPKHISYFDYRLIKVTDQRTDTSNVGFIYGTILKRLAYVQPSVSLKDQLQTAITYIADSTGNGELLLQVRKMKFIQRTNEYDDNGVFFFRANLYSKNNTVYTKIACIDTLLVVPNSEYPITFTKKAGQLVSDFVFNNSYKQIQNKNWSYHDIIKIDSVEKSQAKAYCVGDYTNGVYTSFDSFKKQTPDFKASKLKFRSITLKKVYKNNSENKSIKVDVRNVFAVVEKGNIYISTEYGFRTLYKFDGDFYFIGKGSRNLRIEDVLPKLGGFILLPLYPILITSVLISVSPKSYFETKVDHVDGRFMRCKQIKTY
jgi:hypothetical protein